MKDIGISYVFDGTGRTRAFLDCPETGTVREIESIALVDGGTITFPRDFSANCPIEKIKQALPRAPVSSEPVGD